MARLPLASGIPFTCDNTLYWSEVPADGNTYPDSGVNSSGEFAYTANSGSHYVRLDLGAVYTVDKIKTWHYFIDGRSYHGVKLQVGTDGSAWSTLFDSAVNGRGFSACRFP